MHIALRAWIAGGFGLCAACLVIAPALIVADVVAPAFRVVGMMMVVISILAAYGAGRHKDWIIALAPLLIYLVWDNWGVWETAQLGYAAMVVVAMLMAFLLPERLKS